MNHKITESLYRLDLDRRRKLQPFFTALGLTPGQPRILRCLLEQGEALTQRALADTCLLEAATLSRALDRLEESGLVCRAPHGSSRRANLISLTPEGEVQAQKVAEGFRRMEDALCDGFSSAELADTIAMLEKLRANLEKLEDLGQV